MDNVIYVNLTYRFPTCETKQKIYTWRNNKEVVVESGPDHDKRFQATVLIGKEAKGSGWGKSKKEAEQEAARNALEEIKSESS